MRILIVGSGGAGKSTLARRIGERTRAPVIHLDAMYWRPGWNATPSDEWARTVSMLVARESWIMDGNYSGTLDVRLRASDTIVFLDVPRLRCLARIVRRAVRYRGRSRPDMTPGCNERLTWEFATWVWTYPARRRPKMLRVLQDVADEKRVVILRTARDIDAFVASLPLATRSVD